MHHPTEKAYNFGKRQCQSDEVSDLFTDSSELGDPIAEYDGADDWDLAPSVSGTKVGIMEESEASLFLVVVDAVHGLQSIHIPSSPQRAWDDVKSSY